MAKGQQRSNREAKKPKKAAAAKGAKPGVAGTMIETANANRKPPGKAR